MQNIPYGMAVDVAKTRWKTATDSPDTTGWPTLDDATRSIFIDMARVWVQATLDTGLLARPYTYRAAYDSMFLGTYTSLAVAQQHCEHDLRTNVDLEDEGYKLSWIPEHDGDDAVTELSIVAGPDNEENTGYSVTPVPLLTHFDPDAEQ